MCDIFKAKDKFVIASFHIPQNFESWPSIFYLCLQK